MSTRVKKGRPRHREIKVDRDLLHQYLYRKSVNGMVQIKITELAETLDIGPTTLGVIIRKFCEEGRLYKVKAGVSNVGTYTVVDPDVWSPIDEQTWAEEKRPNRPPLWG